MYQRIQHIVCVASFMLSFVAFSQEQLIWSSDLVDTATALLPVKDLGEHTAIWPRIAYRRSTKADTLPLKDVKRFSIFPAADMVSGYTHNQFQVRTGAGLGMNWIPMKGMNFQLGYVGGLANTNLINYTGGVYPRAFFRFKEKNGVVQYHDVRARLSYSPNEHFNFQVGMDNNKIGEGDRSLFLGDYGTPYPFAQIRMNVWRIEYVIMYQFFRGVDASGASFSKYATTHYLSINASKRFNIGLFESVVWKGNDSSQRRGYEWQYLNPILFFRPAEYSMGSSDNVLMGLHACYKLNKSFQVYGQWMIDDFLLSAIRKRDRWWATKYGIQLGIKGYAPFGWKPFSYLSEVNMVRPFTYSHGSTGQSYSNDYSVLAHPYGANFMEWNSQLTWKKKRWDVRLNAIYLLRGGDNSDTVSWGGDVLKSYKLRTQEFGYKIGGGVGYNLTKAQLTVGFQLISKWKLRAFTTLELMYVSKNHQNTCYPGVYFGIRTELWNDKRNY